MVDWTFATRLAGTIAGDPPHRPIGADLPELADESLARVRAYTHLEPETPLPEPEAVSRKAWIDANLTGARDLIEPLSDKLREGTVGMGPLAGPAQAAAGYVLAGEVGALFGFLSHRVLGQYELALLDPTTKPRLLFVAPNIDAAVGKLKVDRDEFLHWVALHEVTHGLQFAAVPWLRGYLGAQIRELIAGLDVNVDFRGAMRLPDAADLRRAVETLRDGDLLSVVTSPEQRAIIDRIQAAMAVIEGHAEHVMDAAGREALPSLDALREALERRRRQASPLAKLFGKLLGLDMKLRQYQLGKAFCDAVVEAEGIDALNRVWRGAEWLPTLAELEDPGSWLTRTREPVSA
ncbi:MAG TPA: zinc-dependent metalloprotease [Solirubrobacteraceae bacterium]|jgi:coenzyme F420 biosynthesis associated uncharacterized protein|nr:zinc-dependent metalloprotease [Solirubrobacteraceae bacterium]